MFMLFVIDAQFYREIKQIFLKSSLFVLIVDSQTCFIKKSEKSFHF